MFERLRSFLMPEDGDLPRGMSAFPSRRQADAEDRVGTMLAMHGLNADLARQDRDAWQTMLLRCATCAGRNYCDTAFARQDAEVPDDVPFCPNREEMENLLLQKALE